jgi:hypothetical protein
MYPPLKANEVIPLEPAFQIGTALLKEKAHHTNQ